MKKANTRMIAILALGMYISLLVTGCKSQDKNINSSDQNVNLHTEVSEIDHSSQAIDKSIISNQNNNILFDAIFIPMAESRIEPSFDDLKAAASLNGLNCIDEAGVTVILDKTSPDSYVRAEPSYETGSKQIGKLVYATLFGEEERQVSVTNLMGEKPNFYIDLNQFGEGTLVSSLEEIREYLNSEHSPANDNEDDSVSTPGVVDNLFIPIAEGIIGKDVASIKLLLEDLGYNYYNGETYFYIYDPTNPDHYLYGSPFLLEDKDEIDILGVCVSTPKDDVSAEIFYFKDPIEYYIHATELDSRTQVESLKELMDYLN